MNDSSKRVKLEKQLESELEAAQQVTAKPSFTEFNTPEELLRHDAATIEVPDTIAKRLAVSAGKSPPDPWWKRFFNG